MKTKLSVKMTVLGAVVGLLVAGPTAYAFHGGENSEGFREARFKKRGGPERMYKELGLSQEQKDKLKARREADKEQDKALREQLRTKMKTLHDEIAKPETDRAAVDQEVAEINEIKGQLFSRRIDGLFRMKEVLTPEQFTKLQCKHDGKMAKKQGRWQKKARTGASEAVSPG